MGTKRSHSGSDSSSVASSSDSDSEVETRKRPTKYVYSSSESKSSDEEEEWNAKPVKGKAKAAPKKKANAKTPGRSKAKRSKKSDSDDGDSDKSSDESDSESGSGSGSGSDSSSSRKRPSPPKKSAKGANAGKRAGNKFDKEEGEVDFDSDSSEEFNDGFDENLMGDEEDQKMLAKMTEKEREQELFNRSEKRELLRARFEIGRKLKKKRSADPDAAGAKEKEKDAQKEKDSQKETKKKETAKKKDKIDDDSSEQGNQEDFDFSVIPDVPSRSTERRRQNEDNRKGKAAIELLKAEREKKKLKQKLRAADVFSSDSDSDSGKDRKRRSSSSSSDSSSSSNDDSDDDSGTNRRKSRRDRRGRDSDEEKEKFVMTRENLNELIVSRARLENWCFAPFFKDTITGCFLRFKSEQVKNQHPYVIGQVLSVVETAKTYELGRGRTNLGVKVKCPGVQDQIFRFEFVSNQRATEDEFNILSDLMEKHSVEFVTREQYEKKLKDLEKAKNYNYTDADIDYEVKQKEKFKTRPVNFAMKKAELMKEKVYAEQQNNHERAIELGREIDRLEAEAKELESKRTVHIKSISYINERNRNKNILDGSLSNSSGGRQAIADDPFTRRRCAPQIYTKKHADGEQKVEEEEKVDVPVIVAEVVPKKEEKKSAVASKVDDMFDAHNFEIKLDFPSADI